MQKYKDLFFIKYVTENNFLARCDGCLIAWPIKN